MAGDVGGFGAGGDAVAAGVVVGVEAEGAGAGPGVPAAHPVEVEGSVVLFGGGGEVGFAGAADAAPGGEVELVGAVVAVDRDAAVVVAGFAVAELRPGGGRGVGGRGEGAGGEGEGAGEQRGGEGVAERGSGHGGTVSTGHRAHNGNVGPLGVSCHPAGAGW